MNGPIVPDDLMTNEWVQLGLDSAADDWPAPLSPAPLPVDACVALELARDRAFRAYQLEQDPTDREAARLAFLAAHDEWAVAWYGGDGSPWPRSTSRAEVEGYARGEWGAA